MITVEQCVESFKKSSPKIKIVSCKDYEDYYLFTAYVNDDELDPFYLVDKESGDIYPYTISEDPSKYYNAKELLK